MKNLLIISSRYPHSGDTVSGSFVKSQVDHLKNLFEKIVVVSITPYTPRFYSPKSNPKRKRDSLAINYIYENVEVYFTRDKILPFEFYKQKKGKIGYKRIMTILNDLKFKPDLIHAHFTWPSGYIAMELKNKYNIPFVLTAHGYDVYDLPFRNSFYNNTVKNVLKNADKIISVSKNNKDIMVSKLNITPNNIIIIPNGFDEHLFSPLNKMECRKKLSLPNEKKIILSIGNLLPVKGHNYLIAALKIVLQLEKNVILIIIGEGPERQNLDNQIKKGKLEKNIILQGLIPHNEIPLWLNSCDLFVLPSLREGVPTVLFEALGTGSPVVGTTAGGIPDILNDDKLGIVVPSADVASLSQAIANAFQKEWDKDYIINNSKKYSWEKISFEINNIYEDVLKMNAVNISVGENDEAKN